MADNATLDLISFTNTTSGKSTAGTKSYISNSSDFANALSNANKTFSSQNDVPANKNVQNRVSTTKLAQNPTTNDADKAANSIQKSSNSEDVSRPNTDNSAKKQGHNDNQRDSKVDERKTDNVLAKNDSSEKAVKNNVDESSKRDSQTTENVDKTEVNTKYVNTNAEANTANNAVNIQIPQSESKPIQEAPKNDLLIVSDEKNTVDNMTQNTTENSTKKAVSTESVIDSAVGKITQVKDNLSVSQVNDNSTINIKKDQTEVASATDKMNETDVTKKTQTKNEKDLSIDTNADKSKIPMLSATAENVIDMLALNQQLTSNASDTTTKNPNIDDTIIQSESANKLNDITSNFGPAVKQANNQMKGVQANKINNDTSINQSKQALNSNVNLTEQDSSLIPTSQNQDADVAAKTLTQDDINSDFQNVKASTEAIVSNIDVKNTNASVKQNASELLKKTSLTQDVLDKTNAVVESVETSNSSSGSNQDLNSHSNNLRNNQNTEDQLAKLALQDDTQNNSSSLTLENSTQTNFAGILDNIQKPQTINQSQIQTQMPTQPSKELSNADIMEQVNGKLNNLKLKDEGTSKVTIVLKPENLGKINLELVNSKEGLTAQLTTNNSQVKEILDKTIDNLKESLGSQGINVNSVTVKVETSEKSSNDTLSFQNQAGQNNQQQQSDNANHSSENEFKFDKEMSNVTSKTDSDSETEEPINAEKQVSIGSKNGRVDYKI